MHSTIFIDGSCDQDKFGGWGLVIYRNQKIIHTLWGSLEQTTNSQMEILSLLKVYSLCVPKLVKHFPKEIIEIYTDSKYVQLGFNNCELWEQKSWSGSNKQLIKYRKAWTQIIQYKKAFPQVTLDWIKAHNNCPGNELAHQLANRGRLSIKNKQ